jgi:hypothetical protein
VGKHTDAWLFVPQTGVKPRIVRYARNNNDLICKALFSVREMDELNVHFDGSIKSIRH